MTDTTTTAAPADSGDAATRGALSGLRLPQLQALASELGVKGTSKMRKGDLLEAIRSHQGGGASANGSAPRADVATATEVPATERPARRSRRAVAAAGSPAQGELPVQADTPALERTEQRQDRPERTEQRQERGERQERPDREQRAERQDGQDRGERTQRNEQRGDRNEQRGERNEQRGDRGESRSNENRSNEHRSNEHRNDRNDRSDRNDRGDRNDNRTNDNRNDRNDRNDNRNDNRNDRNDNRNDRNSGPDDDDEAGGGRRRRNRYRDRKRRGGRGGNDLGGMADEPEVSDDDVLVPVAGILDVLDSYGFVRTSGYLPGSNDVYVSLGQVKKHGMRKGDAIVGAVRQPREGEQQGGGSSRQQKFNALVRVDSVNGQTVEQAKARPDFMKLTPLYPQERLRLETEPNILTTRVLDLVAPIGKGQRALIVSPPKAGKTMMMQAIANAITVNNPEVHLMVVLVDERPEEVTDFQRSVKGEVIASTFDRPASDHTTVAELAIERAKRLVEMGHDVVILLDGITRLGRAYNISAPASGRILSGGVDSSALYPPKRFFGAARNIENGGSLTILATALVETGSKADEVIFEEFKGTGNSEFRLSRSLADKRVYPAVDVNASGTRREEILLGREELSVMWKLRRVLTALDSQQAIELLLSKLRETKSNTEFLMQVQKTTTPLAGNGKDD